MKNFWKAIFSAAVALTSVDMFATNGLLLTSYGVRYAGMGGASLALHGSAMDIAMNPANMVRNDEKAIVEGGVSYFMPSMHYTDQYISASPGASYYSDIRGKNPKEGGYIMPHLAYTKKVSDKLAVGIAFYAYAGGGSQLNGITRGVPGFSGGSFMGGPGQNPNPTIDELMAKKGLGNMPYIGGSKYMTENTYSKLQVARLTPGVAYKLTDKLSLGLGVDVNIATMEWRWTFSDPMNQMELPGAGFRYKGDTAYALSAHIGTTYQLTDTIAVAYAYQAQSKLNFNGKTSIDAGDPTKVGMQNTSMFLKLPESHRGGLAYHKGAVTVSFDLSYIKWASAIHTVSFKTGAAYANTPPVDASSLGDKSGNDNNELNFHMNWVDQRVYALGFEYKPNKVSYRAGYNYGNSPVTSAGLNPLFPAIVQHHASVGLGLAMGNLDLNFALEYGFNNKVRSGDMSDWEMFHAFSALNQQGIQNPYYNSSVAMKIITPMIGVSYKF